MVAARAKGQATGRLFFGPDIVGAFLSELAPYVGVIAAVAGQGLRWNSPPVLAYAAELAMAFHTWVRVYEGPRLQERFGAAYEHYMANVPRWPQPVPR